MNIENKPTSSAGGVASKLARLLQLLHLLSIGIERNSDEFAEILGVSRRTIFRDLETLQEAGVHILYDTFSKSYRLGRELKLNLRLPRPDIVSMAIALTALRQLPMKVAPAVAQIEGAILEGLSSLAETEFRNALRFVSWQTAAARHSMENVHLDRLFHGFVSQLKIRITYQCHGGIQATLLSPSNLFVGEGTLHISGWSSCHRCQVLIDVNEILTTESTDDPFCISGAVQGSSDN